MGKNNERKRGEKSEQEAVLGLGGACWGSRLRLQVTSTGIFSTEIENITLTMCIGNVSVTQMD